MSASLVYITAPSQELAKGIAKVVVEERLAACANIIPQMTSLYWWEGKVTEDSEVVVMLKTRSELFDVLKQRIKELHPYAVPCIIALPIVQGHDQYIDWIKEETQG